MRSVLLTIHDPVANTNDDTVIALGGTLDIKADDGNGNKRTVIAIEAVNILNQSVHLHIRFVGIAHPKDAYLFIGDCLDLWSIEDGGDDVVTRLASVTLQEVRQ